MSGILLEIGAGPSRGYSRHWKTLDCGRWKLRIPTFVCTLGKEPIPLPDASVEVVFGGHVVEHVLETDELFAEVARVLVPGGLARFVVPDVEALLRAYVAYLDTGVVADPICAWLGSSRTIRRQNRGMPPIRGLTRVLRGMRGRAAPDAHKWPFDRESFRFFFGRHGFEQPSFPAPGESADPRLRASYFNKHCGRGMAYATEARRKR